MVDCLSWHSCYGTLRASKEKRTLSKTLPDQQIYRRKQVQYELRDQSNFSCVGRQSKKKQQNSNNNNNNNVSLEATDESQALLQFHVLNISRERHLHLCTNSNDKRLLSFYNISNGLYKNGLRNGE